MADIELKSFVLADKKTGKLIDSKGNIIQDENRLGLVATTVTLVVAIVTAVVQGTFAIIGAVKAKKMREAMQSEIDNILEIKAYVQECYRGYNGKAYEIEQKIMADTKAKLSGSTVITSYESTVGGVVNDGYAEMYFNFPESIQGSVANYNQEMLSLTESQRKEKLETLHKRLKMYGLKTFSAPNDSNYRYLVGINDKSTVWNDQRKENWFNVNRNGEISINVHYRNLEKGLRASEERDRKQRTDMHARERDDWENRLEWLQEAGIMAWIFRACYGGKNAYNTGKARAESDFAALTSLVKTVNSEKIEAAKLQAEENAIRKMEQDAIKEQSSSKAAAVKVAKANLAKKKIVVAKKKAVAKKKVKKVVPIVPVKKPSFFGDMSPIQKLVSAVAVGTGVAAIMKKKGAK